MLFFPSPSLSRPPHKNLSRFVALPSPSLSHSSSPLLSNCAQNRSYHFSLPLSPHFSRSEYMRVSSLAVTAVSCRRRPRCVALGPTRLHGHRPEYRCSGTRPLALRSRRPRPVTRGGSQLCSAPQTHSLTASQSHSSTAPQLGSSTVETQQSVTVTARSASRRSSTLRSRQSDTDRRNLRNGRGVPAPDAQRGLDSHLRVFFNPQSIWIFVYGVGSVDTPTH